MITLTFYENDDKFKSIQRFEITKEHHYCGMLVNDRRPEKEKVDRTAYVAMVGYNHHAQPGKIVKFSPIASDPSGWDDQPLIQNLELPDGLKARVLDCYLIEKNQIVVVSAKAIQLFNSDLQKIKEVLITEIHKGIEFTFCCRPALESNNSYLLAHRLLQTTSIEPNLVNESNTYTGSNVKFNSWVMKAEFDTATAKFNCKNPLTNSMFFKNEWLESVVAFPPNGLVVFTAKNPTDVIILRDWKVTTYIAEPVPGNKSKYYQALFPGFDLETCPYVVTSGGTTYNSINIKTGRMCVLVNDNVPNYFGQQAFFFVKRGSCWEMHFSTRHLNDQNERESNWYRWPLRQDFLDMICTYGHLPYDSIEEPLQDLKEMKAKIQDKDD